MCQCQWIINWYVNISCMLNPYVSLNSVPLYDSSTICNVNPSSVFTLDFTKFMGIGWMLCFVTAYFSLSLLRWVFCSSSQSPSPSHQQFREVAEKSCAFQGKKKNNHTIAPTLPRMNFCFTCSFLPSPCDIPKLGCEVGEVPALPSSKQRTRILSQFASQGCSHKWPMLRVI